MECAICHVSFEPPEIKDCAGKDVKTSICGTCAQILMDEQQAYEAQQAYEDRERERNADNGGGWRYC